MFKDIDDIKNFFEGLGVHDLVQNQPSVQDVIGEIKEFKQGAGGEMLADNSPIIQYTK